MTVAQLIKALRKQDPKAIVYWADHDQSDTEVNARVRIVTEGSEALIEARLNIGDDAPEIVVLSP